VVAEEAGVSAGAATPAAAEPAAATRLSVEVSDAAAGLPSNSR
jgi:hypothetical protein